jgi:hypothetical protein
MAVVILFMGIASPLFTRRMKPATNVLLEQMGDRAQNAALPAVLPTPANSASVPADVLMLKTAGPRVRP